MKPSSKRILGVFFLLSGIIFLSSCVIKQDKRRKALETRIIAEETEAASRGEEYYFGGNTSEGKTWDINVNQAGYRPKDEKIAVIRDNCGSSTYQILDESGDSVYAGTLTESYTDTDYNETLYYADFTKFQTEGTYYIMCGDKVASPVFDISDSLYEGIAQLAVKPFTTEAYFTTNVAVDHKEQEVAKQKERELLVTMSQKALLSDDDRKIDVSGGWYSDSNEGWVVVPSVTALANMMYLKQYDRKKIEKMPGQTKNSNINLDSIIREELEWLFKMQDTKNGGVYHKASTQDGSMDGENPQIYVSAISTCATADFAAIMAKASTLYEYTDKEFADQCIEAAEKAWAYLKKHEENISFQNETGITSREYSDDSDADERFWAAIELYLATGEEEYRNKAKEYDLDHAAIEFGWSDVAGYACFDFYTRVDKKETELYKKIEKVLKREVQETKENSDLGYRINSQYAVGSLQQVLNRAVLLCLMDKETKKESSASYVKNYLNYVMGENPESKNAFQEMISEKKDQTVEVSSALLVVIQGLDDK